MTEHNLQKKIVKILKKDYKIVKDQVPLMNRCADVVYVDDSNEIISLEIKLKNWKQAIKQAKDHSLVVDRSYICMPSNQNYKKNIEFNLKLREFNIGLLFFDTKKNNFEVVHTPSKSVFNWKPSRKKLALILNV